MLDKVMPDLHHSYSQIEVETRRVDTLTREELEELVAGGRLIEAETSKQNQPPTVDECQETDPAPIHAPTPALAHGGA